MRDGERSSTGSDIERRQFLRRAAVVGTTAWAAPLIVTIRPAAAAALSPPPRAPQGGGGITPLVGGATNPAATPTPAVADVAIAPSSPPSPPGAGAGATAGSTSTPDTSVLGTLARTGADIDRLTALGLGAIGTGAALVIWSGGDDRPDAPPASG